MKTPKALDGNVIEEGAKFFLRSGRLVNITRVQVDESTAYISYNSPSARNVRDNRYTLEGELQRSDYETEHDQDIFSLHSYKSNDFGKAMRSLEAKSHALRA